MASKLEQLLASIDPAKTYDQTFARANTAVNTFKMNSAQITHRDEFIECLTQFFCQVDSTIFKIDISVYSDSEFHWGRCRSLLSQLYGSNGERVAFDMARTGNGGGLYAVLKAMALRMAEEYAENEIGARVSDYWNHLASNEILPAVDEYIDRYGHLLPSEMTESGGVGIKGNFLKVLKHHPKLIRTLRNVGR
jgi:hypothetical protein